MTADEYLREVLDSQALGDDSDEVKALQTHRADVEKRIRDNFVGGGEKGYQFGGRKGTTCAVTLWPILLVLRLHYRRLFCGKPVAPVTGRCVQ